MKSSRKKGGFRLPRYIALIVLASSTSRVAAQAVDWGESTPNPGVTYLVPHLMYLESDMEFEADTYSSPGSSLKYVRWYVSPTGGVEWANYIYHPELLTYSILFEPGYIWERSGTPGNLLLSDEVALDGEFKANLLDAKPYATTLNYTRSQQEIKYDFYNSATVDSQSWGALTGFQNATVPVTLSYEQSQVDSVETGQTSDTGQTTVNLDAKNERLNDNVTTLDCQYGEFDRQTGVPGFTYNDYSSYEHVNLMDLEHFRISTLRSSFMFENIGSANSGSSTELNALVDYSIQHSPRLSSDYNYTFSRYEGDGSDSIQNSVAASLHHQLFESLTSSLELQGSSSDSSGPGSSIDLYSLQATDSENYSKKISNWGNLSIDETLSYTINDQQANGSQTLIANESDVIATTGLVTLKQPPELSVSSVTDSTGTITLVYPQDYTIPDPAHILISSDGLKQIPAGSTILVTYTVQSNPSGTYSVFADTSEIRLGFFHGLADVFALYSLTENQASSSEFVLQDQHEFEAGADFGYKNLSLSCSYIDNDSTLYNSQAYDLGESYSLTTTSHSRLAVNFSQQWDDYSFNGLTTGTQTQNSTFYNFMLSLEWHPTANLNWNTEAGLQKTMGSLVNQDLFAVRSYLNWHEGKLEIHLGYEHEDQDYMPEKMMRDYAFIRIRRNF